MKENIFERTVGMDIVRATEAAALNSASWIGKGEKELADEAASDAIRGMFDLMKISGEVTIGEGIKDNAPGLFKGEKVGTWEPCSPRYEIALDPIDGTTNISKGLPNAISCIAAAYEPAEPEPNVNASKLLDIPSFYMDKLAYGPAVRDAYVKTPSIPLSVEAHVADNLEIVSKILGKRISDITVQVLDRPRNEHYIEAIRSAGAKLRMIVDGDIASAIAPSLPGSGVDLYMGIGGSPEGVLSAAGIRCLGGGQQAKIWPASDGEIQKLKDTGWSKRIDHVFLSKELATGNRILFAATGILRSPFIKGISVQGHTATTHSVLMRTKFGTTRFFKTLHNLRYKTIRLRSINGEKNLG